MNAHEHSDTDTDTEYDVVVVGGGNAAFSAAHAARERGARVLILEKAAREEAGGNSFYTAGAFRVAHDGLDDLLPLVDDASRERADHTALPPYPAESFHRDMERLTDGRNDAGLTRVMVEGSRDIVHWLAEKGVRWQLLYERQTYLSNGEWVFFGGLNIGTVDGGKGLVSQHTEQAARSGVEIRYRAEVTDLLRGPDGAVTGVRYRDSAGATQRVPAGAVVLASGGFQASPERRARYLGEEWRHALLRGNPLSTGEVLDIALRHGAEPFGDWESCHSVQWDARAPENGGDRRLTNQLTRQSYPMGIVVNTLGRRFVDEGADYRNYTYARYGREVLRQPGQLAFQVFDAKTRPLLRVHEYDSTPISSATAQSLPELADALGIDRAGFLDEVRRFNSAIAGDRPFDPAVKDGRRSAVEPPKSNWAMPMDTPPYYGYPVRCGVTFTFGGVRVDPRSARVMDTRGRPITGLYAAGELVGGLFWGNYPGGSGLTAGTVLGRIAGYDAADSM